MLVFERDRTGGFICMLVYIDGRDIARVCHVHTTIGLHSIGIRQRHSEELSTTRS